MLKNWCVPLLLGCLLVVLSTRTTHADLQAFLGTDVIELNDGTRIQCLILMESSRGVLIITPDPDKGEDAYRQQFIPSSQIKQIIRGERQGDTKTFQTDTDLARKVIQGSGFRPAEDAKPAEPAVPTGPISPATPPVVAKPAEPTPAVGKGALPAKALAEAYLQRFPALEDAAEQLLGGRSQLTAALEKALTEPTSRQEAERMLDLFLQTTPSEKPVNEPGKHKTTKPAPRNAKPAPATGK